MTGNASSPKLQTASALTQYKPASTCCTGVCAPAHGSTQNYAQSSVPSGVLPGAACMSDDGIAKAVSQTVNHAPVVQPLSEKQVFKPFITPHTEASAYSLHDYQNFVNGMKVYPERFAIIYPTLGMMGEAGEVSEKVKKWMRGDRELDKAELIKEIGDVIWYATSLADDLGYTINDVVTANVLKLSSRKERGVLKGEGDNR